MLHLTNWLHQVKQARGRAAVMGILNLTPDSFSDGGRFTTQQSIEQAAKKMIADGVDIIDIGGESTRPGADKVSLDEELQRVIPAIEWIRQFSDIPMSIDTYKPEVMATALSAGASMINDVNALQELGAKEVAAEFDCPVCLMHKKGIPKTMQSAPFYENVVAEVFAFLHEQKQLCMQSGIRAEQIAIDPGFGFGKRLEDNVALFKATAKLKKDLTSAVLIGVSRKSMIGQILNLLETDERMIGSVAAAMLAAQQGADIVRVHDVKETVQALEVAAILGRVNE